MGVATRSAEEGESVPVLYREALTSLDGSTLTRRLEDLHSCVFSHIPDLPPPSQIDHLLVVIAPDLKATAYVNELQFIGMARAARPVQAGESVYLSDIRDLESIDLGVSIPSDHALIVVRSHGWRQTLFYDFGPLLPEVREREYDLSAVLAMQTLSLLKGNLDDYLSTSNKQLAANKQLVIVELETLLRDHCENEVRYQELLEQYPWFLGGQHTCIERHTSLDDRNIPDFTGVRARDGARDLFEIKQPFLKCFLKDGGFSAKFNAAYEQAERYLAFVRNNKEYLRLEKGLTFNNPRCFLLVGWELSATELRRFQEREANNPLISLLTYEHVLKLGRAQLALIEGIVEEADSER